MAMARELVTEKGIGESADAVWKLLQKQQAEVFGERAVDASVQNEEAHVAVQPEAIIPAPAPVPEVVTQLLMFDASLETAQRRKVSRRATVAAKGSSQLALF